MAGAVGRKDQEGEILLLSGKSLPASAYGLTPGGVWCNRRMKPLAPKD